MLLKHVNIMSLICFLDLQDNNTKVDSNEAPAIGFNLPKEFQARMNISEQQNIYPPLNVSTAGKLLIILITHFLHQMSPSLLIITVLGRPTFAEKT